MRLSSVTLSAAKGGTSAGTVPFALLRVTLLLLLSGGSLAAQRTRTVIVIPGQTARVISDTMGTPYEVPASAGKVFAALAAVYVDLKLPTEIRDSAMLQVGDPAFARRETVAGKQISTYLSCGEGMTGPYADYYRIYLSLVTTITPKTAGSVTLRTVLLAGAVNVTEGAHDPQPCESSGRLEARIHQMVLKKLYLPS